MDLWPVEDKRKERREALLKELRCKLEEMDALGYDVPAIHLCMAIELLERE
jgi:hypothetical protein